MGQIEVQAVPAHGSKIIIHGWVSHRDVEASPAWGKGRLLGVTMDPRQRGIGATWFMPANSGEPLMIDLPDANLDFASSLARVSPGWTSRGTCRGPTS